MEKKSGLGWLSPTPRLIVFILLSIAFTISQSWTAILVSFAIGLALLVAGRKYPRAALVACASAGILTFLGNALFAGQAAQYTFLFFGVSRASLINGLRLGMRIMAMILPAIAFIAVTPLPEYLVAFRGLRVPAAVEMYLTVVLRYVDILWYEIQISMKAMAMRGVNWEGSVSEKVPAFRRLMLPLILRIFEHVDGQSLAIDNRGGISVRPESLEVPAGAGISMHNVYVRYDRGNDPDAKHALAGIDLEIAPRTTSVLLGKTGSGKSSLMLLSTGLIPNSVGRMKGRVELFGYDTQQAPLNRIGLLARLVLTSAVQGLVGLTVRDELRISLRAVPLAGEQVQEAMLQALRSVGLDASFLDRLTLGLSGGEMQRVAIASALIAHPRLLALDDVTMQLDPRGKRDVIAALRGLAGEKMTTVMSDSQVSLLIEQGDRFISLEAGRIARDADSLEVETIQKAGLRIPQMWALGARLGMDLPLRASEAAGSLRGLAMTAPAVPPGSHPEGAPLVSTDQITYTYPNGPTALKGISVSFHRGEFVAILGSNGSGKTTAAMILAGAMAPTTGRVLIGGDEPFDRAKHRGIIGYVFQEPVNQMVTMRVEDELAFGPQMLGWDAERARQSVERELARFGLPRNAVPVQLQPAEARKVSIAATLTLQPQMIILDEPTNNLDAGDVDQLMEHLKGLQRDGTTVVMITHDIEVALRYAEHLIVMSDGRVIADGPTRQVAAQPELLAQSDVMVPPVVELSLALWPDLPPALTVEEMAAWLRQPAGASSSTMGSAEEKWKTN